MLLTTNIGGKYNMDIEKQILWIIEEEYHYWYMKWIDYCLSKSIFLRLQI